jgi:LysR family transcriptional regulator, glycine cleavage system transcriptional activator
LLRLPPLNALRAFEAAARHLSFKAAAEELCVTQSAISRHILNLEDHLGARLFERRHRQVALTRDGQAYVHSVRAAFTGIAGATTALFSDQQQRMLKLKLPPTCAIRWLVPRLARFHAVHPDMSVQVTTSHDPVDFDANDIDAGVEYGPAIGRGLAGERLFGEVLVPVVAARAGGGAPPRRPEDLGNHLLLHSIQRPDDWPQWFEAAGVPEIGKEQGLIFENSSLTYQGAVDGLGIAMAQVAFVIDELHTGRLTEPFDVRVHHHLAYHFVYPKERSRIDRIRKFHAWIAEEAARTRKVGEKYGL